MVVSRVVSKHRTVIILCFILIGSLISITADLRATLILDKVTSFVSCGLYPLHRGVAVLQRVATGAFEALFAGSALRRENKRLKETVDSLCAKVVRAQELDRENERLRKLLGFAEREDLSFKPVEVIGNDASNWFSTVTIDKGSKDGIGSNMCVVTDRGIVGRVLNVQPLTARVLLLSDSNSRIGAIVQRTRAQGVVQGDDRGGCIMKYLDPMADVERGDLVVTSGDSLIFPKGLAIGEVTRVERGDGELLQLAQIKLSAELSQLEEAFVILP